MFRPHIACTSFQLNQTSKLTELRKLLNKHDFNSEKIRKRKRGSQSTAVFEEQGDVGLLIQDALEAMVLAEEESTQSGTGENMLRISIQGLLHPSLPQKLLKHLT